MRQILVVLGDDVFGAHVAVVDRGMRVGHKHYVITQLMGLTHGGVDAVIGLQTADDQLLEVFARQQFAQVSLVERVRGGFAYAQVFGRCLKPFGQLPAFGTLGQRAVLLFVLNQHHRHTCLSGAGAETVDGVDHSVNVMALVFARAEGALDVDDQ